jgi:hypothetical protein
VARSAMGVRCNGITKDRRGGQNKWCAAGCCTDQQEIMVFGFRAQVLEDSLLPVALHMIPVLDHAMSDRIMDTICLTVGESFVPDEEVEVVDPPLGREMTRFTGNWWTACLGARSCFARGYCCWYNAVSVVSHVSAAGGIVRLVQRRLIISRKPA